MPTGMGAPLPDAPPLVTVFFLVIIFYHCRQRDKAGFHDLVSKLSIMVLQMLLQRCVGCTTYYTSYFIPLYLLPWSIATMSMRFTCPQTQYIISARNTSRLIFIFSKTHSLWVRFVFVMSLQYINMKISSPKGFHRLYFLISDPI